MAKKIVVNENEDVKVISKVTKLVTSLSNGENCTWVPEDEIRLINKSIIKDGDYIASKDVGAPYGYSQVTVNGIGNKILGQLGEKNITKNGTYIAENDSDGPYYGYSRVVVNVEGGDSGSGSPVVGKDDDGDDAIPKIDDDGHIVTEKLPTRISINVYPNNLVYEDGQDIDFTGLRVKAFLPDDTEWGVVPNEEILTPVTVADGSSSSEDSGTANFIYSAGTYVGRVNERSFYKSYDGRAVALFLVSPNSWRGPILISSTSDFACYTYETQILRPAPFNYEGSTLYINYFYHYSNTDNYDTGGLPVVNWPGNYDGYVNGATAYLKAHNYRPGQEDQQIIPLQWWRPGDKKVLETSFSIAVHDSSGGDNNTSGGNVTPGTQNIDVPQ